MCKPGNQSTRRECFEAILRLTGRKTITNQEKQRILEEHGGCMRADPVKVFDEAIKSAKKPDGPLTSQDLRLAVERFNADTKLDKLTV